ncbi:hypothetical protein [Psychrobacter sp. UBA2514]|jgi:hypothetical protein|uniref:hypothetical protein n=1 Tax=Psychrobacter sp. UBA2514 TaxID=1947346 RepID=UPI00257F3BC5|nr:hypothetical protein [Psychrobacter sp. UBA2514]|tara:strand:+ start:14829 stop:15470 length:642 start_codon:yes stop_codon:yes gene_type:complete
MKVTKRELLRRIEALEEWRDYADEMLTELNHALPDPEHDAKCAENAVAVEESLERHAVRLGLKKPKLKQLDQSVFDGQPKEWRFLAVDFDGETNFFESTPKVSNIDGRWYNQVGAMKLCSLKFDTTNWQNSLIERDKVELTGSDLCRYLKSRKHWVLAVVSDENDATAEFHQRAVVVTGIASDGDFVCGDTVWRYAVPIDHKGEPLTAADVGL